MLIVVKRTDMRCRKNHNSIAVFVGSLMLVVFIMLSGCSQPAGSIFTDLNVPLVWPQPPETARIAYVGMISTEEDLKPARSWSQGLQELFFGKDNIGVLVSPTAVVCDGEKIYVTDSAAGVLHMFDLQTRDYHQITSMDDGQALVMPVAIIKV